jgi:hypothetical protein
MLSSGMCALQWLVELFGVSLMSVFFDRTDEGKLLTCRESEERRMIASVVSGVFQYRRAISSLPYRSSFQCSDHGLMGRAKEHAGVSKELEGDEMGFSVPGSAVQAAVGVFDVHIPAYLAFNLLIDQAYNHGLRKSSK